MVPARNKRIDEELIARSAAGDPASREALADACIPIVWRTVYLSCNGGPEVEDLVQGSLMQAFKDLPRFSQKGSFTSWLHRVTLNVVRQHFRRRAVRSLLFMTDEVEKRESTAGLSPAQGAEGGRFMRRLAGHLAKMGEKNRNAVVLSVVEGYSASEIALVAGCGHETAKKRLGRGRRELVSRLEKDPYFRKLVEELSE